MYLEDWTNRNTGELEEGDCFSWCPRRSIIHVSVFPPQPPPARPAVLLLLGRVNQEVIECKSVLNRPQLSILPIHPLHRHPCHQTDTSASGPLSLSLPPPPQSWWCSMQEMLLTEPCRPWEHRSSSRCNAVRSCWPALAGWSRDDDTRAGRLLRGTEMRNACKDVVVVRLSLWIAGSCYIILLHLTQLLAALLPSTWWLDECPPFTQLKVALQCKILHCMYCEKMGPCARKDKQGPSPSYKIHRLEECCSQVVPLNGNFTERFI